MQEAERGTDVLERIDNFHPDIILLDLMLPDLSGFDVCREIRRAGHRMPVVILSAKNEEIDVVLGLEIGADDYINKPFRPRELLARIAAHLRKAKETRGEARPEDGRLVFRDLVIDTAERRVLREDRDVILTHTEFDLLAYLATNAGKVLSRERILSSVWGYEHPIETRIVEPARPQNELARNAQRISGLVSSRNRIAAHITSTAVKTRCWSAGKLSRASLCWARSTEAVTTPRPRGRRFSTRPQ